ncbi:MAG: diguanylate cyclase [Bacteroidia bacterium]|nr:MAG: diguanylate cyclase [Bacteroidia bacterium]
MIDLSIKYLGLSLKNPLIVGSSGLTNSVADIKEIEKAGAGAVVLKSIFEEEIKMEYEHELKNVFADESNLEHYDYLDYEIKEENVNKYLELIKSCKKELKIPVIASINCISSTEWVDFAKKIQEVGADAIELNAFILPTNMERSSEQTEQIYFNIADSIKRQVKIPVALKISPYFSNLAKMIKQLSETAIEGIVLFNRFYNPDFDIDKKKIVSGEILSTPQDIAMSLRWVAIMSNMVSCDISASTGVHDAKAMIKQLLAGATSVQAVSTFYKHGVSYIETMLNELRKWMEENNYSKIDDFRAMMSQKNSKDAAHLERVQFMKYFGEKKH